VKNDLLFSMFNISHR